MVKGHVTANVLLITALSFQSSYAGEADRRTLTTRIASSSMLPTLQKDSDVTVTFSSASDPIHRCDIVVLLTRDNKPWTSRVVGLPGEAISIAKARVSITGQLVARDMVPDAESATMMRLEPGGHVYAEHLPQCAEHLIAQQKGEDGPLSNIGTIQVPEDSYFLMGDNRDNAADSRLWPAEGGLGSVPRSAIVGTVVKTGGN